MRLNAIGDVHGMNSMLLKILDKINDREKFCSEPTKVIFVGDYVDRGPESKNVIDTLMNPPSPFVFVCLMGNHERMMIDAFHGSGLDLWLSNGGWATLKSYGIHRNQNINDILDHMNDIKTGEYKHHFDWMKKLPLYHIDDPYFFVHAGMIPGVPMREQHEAHLLWIRDRFLRFSDPVEGNIIVHGHTPTCFDPLSKQFRDTSNPLVPTVLKGRINLDTGACFGGGRLTAARLPKNGDILDVEFLVVEKD